MSTKPWEQDWRAEGCSWVERRDDVSAVAQVQVSGSVDEQAVYNRFLAAAPDMARALMDIRNAILSKTLDPDGAEEVCERALRKAGVL